MSFNLVKGSKFELDKHVTQAAIQLSWESPEEVNGHKFDPDASVFGLTHNSSGQSRFFGDGVSHVVFYGNGDLKLADGKTLQTKDKSITHSGDERSEGTETISIDFSKIPAGLVELAVWITIYDAVKRGHNFSMITNCKLTISDESNGAELANYKLREEFGNSLAVQVGSFVKNEGNGAWDFQALGSGADVEIGKVLEAYQ